MNPSGLDDFTIFIEISHFDSSDKEAIAFIRSIDPKDENEWAYHVVSISNFDKPSNVYFFLSLIDHYGFPKTEILDIL